MFDAERYIAEYQELEHGAPRLRVMKEAIAAADEAKDAHWRFVFRHRYVHESIFKSDSLDALIVFPEMLAVFDENPDTQEEHLVHLMWDFKNLLGCIADFPQVSLDEIEKLHAEYKARCKKYGFTQRSANHLRERLSIYTGNLLPLDEYGTYAEEETDALKDCPACEASWNVKCELLRGNREKAMLLSQPLFNREIHCTEAPEDTYKHWIDYLQKQGDYQTAKGYAKRLYPMVRNRIEMLDCIGSLIQFYAKFDRHIGYNIFNRALHNYLIVRNPMLKMKFAMGANQLFSNMESGDMALILPREFPLYHDKHLYQAAELAKYFHDEAAALAERFDTRNGNSYYTDMLNQKLPDFEESAVDFVHGDAEQLLSALGGVCKRLPDTLTLASVQATLDADGRFHAEMMRANSEQGFLQFQIRDGEAIYQIWLTIKSIPPLDDFRPAFPLRQEVMEEVANAEGVLTCIMPYEEHDPEAALHFQIKFMHLLCPNALVYLDLLQDKIIPAGWMALEAKSNVPPIVDMFYTLHLFGCNDDVVWMMTKGMRVCSLRDVEIWDATKKNFARFSDLLCFVTERFLLCGELPDAGTPFEALCRDDDSPLLLAWLPASQALAYYSGTDCGCTKSRAEMIGENADKLNKNAVLFLYDGENEDGSVKLKRLSTLTEADFKRFRYGQYIATGEKIAALAKERFPIFCDCFAKHPEEAFVRVNVEQNGDDDDVWMQVTAINEQSIYGKLCCECIAGKEDEEYVAELSQLMDFSVRVSEAVNISPNTAYLAN